MPSEVVKGIVIEESLSGGKLPPEVQQHVAHRYAHKLGGVTPVNVLRLSIPAADVPAAALALADSLLPRGYYAHFVSPPRLLVIFPQCICIIRRDDLVSISRARDMGRSIGVPADQMPFERLFDEDHPNVHT